jgi:ankyrin repeat protein
MVIRKIDKKLFYAVEQNSPKKVIRCLKRGANINISIPLEPDFNEITPLIYAIYLGCLNAVQTLLENGARFQANATK